MAQKTKNTQKEKAKKVVDETMENVKQAKDKAKAKATETAEKTKEKVEDFAESTAEAGFWDDVQENISEGAKVLNEEAKEFAEKVSSYSEKIFGAIKETAADAFHYGTNLTKDAVNYAQTMAEKYRDRAEINKLNEEKKKASSQLGMNIYLAYKNNDNRVPVQTFRQKKVKSVMKELEELDRKILELTSEEKK